MGFWPLSRGEWTGVNSIWGIQHNPDSLGLFSLESILWSGLLSLILQNRQEMREVVSHSLHSHIYTGQPPFISTRQKHKDAICYARNPFLCTISGWNRILQWSCHPEFIKADVCYTQFLPTVWLKIDGWRHWWAARLVNWSWTSKRHRLSVLLRYARSNTHFFRESATVSQKLMFVLRKTQFKRLINLMLIDVDKPPRLCCST